MQVNFAVDQLACGRVLIHVERQQNALAGDEGDAWTIGVGLEVEVLAVERCRRAPRERQAENELILRQIIITPATSRHHEARRTRGRPRVCLL
jgi:hypothetical protein